MIFIMPASHATSALNVELQLEQLTGRVCIFTCKNVVKEVMNLEASVEGVLGLSLSIGFMILFILRYTVSTFIDFFLTEELLPHAQELIVVICGSYWASIIVNIQLFLQTCSLGFLGVFPHVFGIATYVFYMLTEPWITRIHMYITNLLIHVLMLISHGFNHINLQHWIKAYQALGCNF